MVIWLDETAGGTGAEDGILRADEVQAVMSADAVRRMARERRKALLEQTAQEARALTEAARAEAAAIVAAAQQEAEGLLEAAREEARLQTASAYDEGRQQAADEWHALLQQQRSARAGALRGMEEALAGIAATAVERLVAAQPREALWRQALAQVQALTRGGATAVMRVAPQDEAEVRAALDALARGPDGEALVNLSVDANLAAGDCVFESEQGVLDAGLALQLHGLRAALGRAVERVIASQGREGGDAEQADAGDVDAAEAALDEDEGYAETDEFADADTDDASDYDSDEPEFAEADTDDADMDAERDEDGEDD